MRILGVEFAGAMGRAGAAVPAELPQVAFAGRSNVGKSSLINRLLGRHRHAVARVSATPGKTQAINFYRVRAELSSRRTVSFHMVDLPGYGFAQAPARVRAAWRPLIEGFFRASERLRGVVQLLDMRHEPTAEDRRMIEFLASLDLPTLFVLTKADKLKASARVRREAGMAADLGVSGDEVIPFSAVTGEGRAELLGALDTLLAEPEP